MTVIVVQPAETNPGAPDRRSEQRDPLRVRLRNARPSHARVDVVEQPDLAAAPWLQLAAVVNESGNLSRRKLSSNFLYADDTGSDQRVRDQHIARARTACGE